MRISELRREELIGKIAKVGFEVDSGEPLLMEWMWVLITRIEGDTLVGKLGNTPQNVSYIQHGDEIRFQVEDVYAGEVYEPGTEGDLDPISRMSKGWRNELN